MKIAFIGAGVMGKSMIMNLCKNGYDVQVYNRTYSKAKDCEQFGAKAFEKLDECVIDVDVVITIVGYPKDVEEVYEVIFNTCKAGTIAIDMTTSSPTLAIELARKGLSKGINVLDAPVSGGDIGAKNATLSIMVGGEQKAFDQCKPLFEAMGKNIIYMGKAGSGQHTKMANQIAIAGTVTGVSEAIAYANKVGLDSELLLSAISAGAAGSWQMANNGPKMINKDYAPGFFIKHFIKDMKLAQDEANAKGFDLPILNEVVKIYDQLAEFGLDEDGTQAIIEYYTNKR